jgi:hypothetical protein
MLDDLAVAGLLLGLRLGEHLGVLDMAAHEED